MRNFPSESKRMSSPLSNRWECPNMDGCPSLKHQAADSYLQRVNFYILQDNRSQLLSSS